MDATRPYILVVDDLPDAADSLAVLITLWGYVAEPLYDGAAALEAARTRRPAVVLLDLGMPRMDGFQVALRLQGLPACSATPIVAVTGHESLVLQAREVDIDYYLVKPVDLSHLQVLLGRLTVSTEPSRFRAEPSRLRKERRTERCVTGERMGQRELAK